jgi:hypothetical protein
VGARKRPAAAKRSEKPSEDPEVLRQVHAENIRKASEALRALKLPNDVEPCVVFRP